MNGFFFVALLALLPLPLPPYFTVMTPFSRQPYFTRNPVAVSGDTIAADIQTLYAMRATPFDGAYIGID